MAQGWEEGMKKRNNVINVDQLDRGDGIPGGQVYAEMKKKSAEYRKATR